MGSPSVAHEVRVTCLDAIATIAGFTLEIPIPLPDGSIPDVIRMMPSRRALFIGEAKAAEAPDNHATLERLDRVFGGENLLA